MMQNKTGDIFGSNILWTSIEKRYQDSLYSLTLSSGDTVVHPCPLNDLLQEPLFADNINKQEFFGKLEKYFLLAILVMNACLGVSDYA